MSGCRRNVQPGPRCGSPVRPGASDQGRAGGGDRGGRWQLGGLLIPGAVALVIAALGQLSRGLATLPRWIGLAIAGTLLIVAGARVEALRRSGRRVIGWVGQLR